MQEMNSSASQDMDSVENELLEGEKNCPYKILHIILFEKFQTEIDVRKQSECRTRNGFN